MKPQDSGFILAVSEEGEEGPAICVMADGNQPGVSFDIARERILRSDHSSTFVVSCQQNAYQLLGVNYYSTTRSLIPLPEVVKKTVQMTQELATKLELDLRASSVVIHYPNIFLTRGTW